MKYLSIIAQTIICVLILSSCGYEQPWFNPIRVENELEYGEPEIEEEINEYEGVPLSTLRGYTSLH